MNKPQLRKHIPRVASMIIGLLGLWFALFFGSLFLVGFSDFIFKDIFLFWPLFAIPVIFIWYALYVIRNWTERSIGYFSAIVSVLCISTVGSYFSDILRVALMNDETHIAVAFSFLQLALIVIVFLLLKRTLIKISQKADATNK